MSNRMHGDIDEEGVCTMNGGRMVYVTVVKRLARKRA